MTTRYARRKLSDWGMVPETRLARVALGALGLWIGLYVLERVLNAAGAHNAADALDGWIFLLGLVNAVLWLVAGVRWVRRVLLWRLRNRLLVTYVFMGVIPVVLIATMAGFAGYLFAGQFATLVAHDDIDTELRGLEAMNSVLTAELASAPAKLSARRTAGPARKNLPGAAKGLSAVPVTYPQFPRAKFEAWYGGKAVAGTSESAAGGPPGWLTENFSGVAFDRDRALSLRAARVTPVAGASLVTVSSMPLDAQTLGEIVKQLGEVAIYKGNATLNLGGNNTSVGLEGSSGKDDSGQSFGQRLRDPKYTVIGGALPAAQNSLDKEVHYGAILPVRDWQNGKEYTLFMLVSTRFSVLYGRLFSNFSELARGIRLVLIFLAVFFAIIELFALMIGLGLTRTITKSVAALYRGTERVNRGDFRHRIAITSHDQLAALESSFNSMTESLEGLIAEQKEKQKLENELAIAQQVQEQLFPPRDVNAEGLELHGICKPARTVSGDYYDFLPLGAERLALAVADISGKGISAALLMATIHSAVRVYELGGAAKPLLVAAGASERAGPATAGLGNGGHNGAGMHSPGEVMAMLNRHLYRSTPAEKYATMFLGVYDGGKRQLTYTNAGHLPPLIVGRDGEVRKLGEGGTVIGLFDEMAYEERRVQMRPGDLFVAYSDGMTEPENEFGEFGEERLLEVLRENRELPLGRLSDAAIGAVQEWLGAAEQPDDLTLVLARAR